MNEKNEQIFVVTVWTVTNTYFFVWMSWFFLRLLDTTDILCAFINFCCKEIRERLYTDFAQKFELTKYK